MNAVEAFNEAMMGIFQGSWTHLVAILASVALLLTLFLLVTFSESRKLRAQRSPSSAARWQKQRRLLEFFSMLTGILLLGTPILTAIFGKDKSPPLWLISGGAVIGAMQLVIRYVQTRGDAGRADDAWTQKVRSLVVRWPLPKLSEVDPYSDLGVTPSEVANHYVKKGERPPYVPRDIDSELDTVLMAHELVLVVGHSKSGKSRTAYESILRLHPQQQLIIPSDGKALAELFRLDPPMEWESNPAIVWLDDLQRFLGPNGLTPSLLNSLCQDKGQLKLVATLTTKRHDDYLRSTSDVDKDSQIILRRFQELHLASGLSAAEAQRAQAVFRDEPREKLAAGLGEHLVAARALTKKYEMGKEVRPQGHALVRAAIDWRRAGMLRPIPETALKKLAEQYLGFLKLPNIDLTPESLKDGLQWAREPVGLHVALLSKVGNDEQENRFEAFDYLVDHVDRQAMVIPGQAWESILSFASPSDALQVGRIAYRRENRAIARKALEQAMQANEPGVSAQAAFVLGVLLQEEHQLSEAEHLYRVAIDSKQQDVTAMAKNNLGKILMERGDLTEAECLLRELIDAKQADVTTAAMVNLGIVHLKRGESVEAERLFREVIDTKPVDAAASAINNLGKILIERGELMEAECLFRKVINSKRADIAAVAVGNLGAVHLKRGELAEAERLFREAIESKQTDAVGMAKNNLGKILLERRELVDAERLFREAIDSRQADVAALAKNNLGKILVDRGELAEAERLFREAIESKEADAAAIAMGNLGSIYMTRGEMEEAERLFSKVIESKQADAAVVAMATGNLVTIYLWRGEMEEAERLFSKVIESKQADAAALTTVNLGAIYLRRGELDAAERFFREVVGSNQVDAAAMAVAGLGAIHFAREEMVEAEQMLRKALSFNRFDITARAAALLGMLLHSKGEQTEAEQLLRLALASHIPEVMYRAALHLGQLLQKKGETGEAERLFLMASKSGDASIVRDATAALVRLTEGRNLDPSA